MKCSNQNTIVAVGCLLALAGACASEAAPPKRNTGVNGTGTGGMAATGTGSTAAAGTGSTVASGGPSGSGTGGSDTGTGGSDMSTGGSTPPAPVMCASGDEPMGMCASAATGVFAIKTVIDVWWKDEKNTPALVDPGRGTITIVLKAEITGVCGDGTGGQATIRACGNSLPYFKSDANCDAFQIVLPDELWDNPKIPSFTSTGMTSGFDPGDVLSIATATGLIGIKLADPMATWPTPAMTAQTEFPDDDGDGKKGITIKMGRIGETLPGIKCGGFQLPFVFRGAPLDALGALADDGLKADTLFIGLRTTLGGGGVIGADCASGVGDSEVKAIDSRVYDCVRTDKMPCAPAQAMFVDNSAPNYHILKKGEVPPADIKQPVCQCPGGCGGAACGLDPTPSKGPISYVVRLGDLGMAANCAAVRGAKFPAAM